MVPAELKPAEEQWQDSEQLEWLEFWQRPWLQADRSWIDGGEDGINPAEIGAMNPALLRKKFLLDGQLPPEPVKAHLDILRLPTEQRDKALLMVAEVVKNRIGQRALEPHNQLWCLRLAKALTPSAWPVSKVNTGSAEQIGQVLLRQWLSESGWCRARLLFPREQVVEMESWAIDPAPAKKVTQLWQAILWRITT